MGKTIKALVVGACAAGIIGVGTVAQAQQMMSQPSHVDRATEAVQPQTRDMASAPKPPVAAKGVRPSVRYPVTCRDGARIRTAPYGTILGLCYSSHSVAFDNERFTTAPDGSQWWWIIDYTTGVSGWTFYDNITA